MKKYKGRYKGIIFWGNAFFYCIAKTGEGVNTGMAKLNTNQMANPLVASHTEKLNTKMNT